MAIISIFFKMSLTKLLNESPIHFTWKESINHKDLCQPISLCPDKPSTLLPAYSGTHLYKREDCMKNHLAESLELHQNCRHDLENQKIKNHMILWEKYFYVSKDIYHQLTSELYLWLRATLKPVEERIITDYTRFKEYVKTQLVDMIHMIKPMYRFIVYISMQHSPNFIYHKRLFKMLLAEIKYIYLQTESIK